jgi:hypothetical protein
MARAANVWPVGPRAPQRQRDQRDRFPRARLQSAPDPSASIDDPTTDLRGVWKSHDAAAKTIDERPAPCDAARSDGHAAQMKRHTGG